MNIKTARSICKWEKQQAAFRNRNDDTMISHDSAQAINAWDEMLDILHKPGNVKDAQFIKAKNRALRVVKLIGDKQYKNEIRHKINTITLS